MTNGFGAQRKSGGADLYLPHLRPRLTESTPRSLTGSFIGMKNESDNKNLFSPILKQSRNRDTKASSSMRIGGSELIHSFDNSKYKVSVRDIVEASKKNSADDFGCKAFGEPSVEKWNPHTDKPSIFTISKDKVARDYISSFQKVHNNPGPKYETILNMSKKSGFYKNPPRTIIKVDEIPTRMQEVEIAAQKTPGPGRYDNDKRKRNTGNLYKTKDTMDGMISDA